MKVIDLPSGDRLSASSDFDAKLVAIFRPEVEASCVTLTVLSVAPVVAFTSDMYRLDEIPKLPSAVPFCHTLVEQVALAQNALLATAVLPVVIGSAAPTPKPGSV